MDKAIEIVGLRIKSYRQKKRLSQERLAELSGLHPTYIGQLERGEKNPSVLSLLKISSALEISLESLISQLSEVKKNEQTVADKAFRLFLEMDEKDGERLYEVLIRISEYKG